MAKPNRGKENPGKAKTGSDEKISLNLDSLTNVLGRKIAEGVSDLYGDLQLPEAELQNTLQTIGDSIKKNFTDIDIAALQNRQEQIISEFGGKIVSRDDTPEKSPEIDVTKEITSPTPQIPANENNLTAPSVEAMPQPETGTSLEKNKTKKEKISPKEAASETENSAVSAEEPFWPGQNQNNGMGTDASEPSLGEWQREKQSTGQPKTSTPEKNQAQSNLTAFDPNNFDVDELIANHEQASRMQLSSQSGKKGGQLAASAGQKYGAKLDEAIKNGNFKAFYIALGFALLKDSWDLIDPVISAGVAGSILNIFISAVLYYIVYVAQYGWMKRFIMKYVHKKLLRNILIEFIPILGFLPMYTILILSIRWKSAEKMAELKKMKAEVDAENQKIEITRNLTDLAGVFSQSPNLER